MNHPAGETSLTVQKALRVIREFSVDGPVLAVSDIARRLDIPRSTASRLIAALCSDGYLRKTPAGTYTLGLKFIDYASVAMGTNAIRGLARSEMLDLRQTLGLSTHLSVFDRRHGSIVHVERLRAGELEQFLLNPGERVPLHATSSGKAHLAFCDDGAIERFTAQTLERFTAATFVNQHRLKDELSAVRQNGYALGCDEFITGVSSVAAPIFRDRAVVSAERAIPATRDRAPRQDREPNQRTTPGSPGQALIAPTPPSKIDRSVRARTLHVPPARTYSVVASAIMIAGLDSSTGTPSSANSDMMDSKRA
jgi:DNA-binding IclR family transcriptional regulator